MKGLIIIRSAFNKRKLSYGFIVLVAVLALYVLLNTSAGIFDQYYSYRVLKNSNLNPTNTFIYGLYPHDALIMQGVDAIQNRAIEDFNTIKESDIVESIYNVRYTGVFKYNDLSFGIILYDPAFLDTFPMLRKYGIDFSGNPHGVIVSHDIFKDLNIGDSFEMTSQIGNDTVRFTCAGHMKYPNKYISFNGISSDIYADIIFDNQKMMIMRADEETLAFLQQYTDIEYKTGAFFSIRSDASAEQIDSLINDLQKNGFVARMDDVMTASTERINEFIKAYMLRPFFLTIASLAAYMSLTIINVFKRRKDVAISYLCGAGKRQILLASFGSCVALSIIPCMLAIVYIINAPKIQMIGNAFDDSIPPQPVITDQIWIVAAFFMLTVLVSFAAVLISMGRKSPLEYLRGLE